MLKLGRGLKMELQSKHDEAITPVTKQMSWQSALDRLTQLFDEAEWQNAEVNIVLSNRLVRYATMLFSAQLKNYSEQEAFARYSLTQTFGATVEQWALRIQHGKPARPVWSVRWIARCWRDCVKHVLRTSSSCARLHLV